LETSQLSNFERGDYDSAIALAHQALDTTVAQASPMYLQRVSGWSAFAAFLIGRWPESAALVDVVYDGMQLYTLEDDDVDGALLASLHMGLAREDRAVTDRAVAALQRFNGAAQRKEQRLVDAYCHDDVHLLNNPAYIGDVNEHPYFLFCGLAFLIERGSRLRLTSSRWRPAKPKNGQSTGLQKRARKPVLSSGGCMAPSPFPFPLSTGSPVGAKTSREGAGASRDPLRTLLPPVGPGRPVRRQCEPVGCA
jgi:hypothetical protein